MGRFIISERANGEYQFNLKANNNQIILTSQGYDSLAGCEKGIESVKQNSKNDLAFHRLMSSNEKHYFNLVAGNHEIIGTSEMYESLQEMENGIESVKLNAPEAPIIQKSVVF